MTMFWWFFLRVGLPVGLLLGVGFAFDGAQTAWLQFVWAVAFPATALASALTVTNEAVVRSVQRTRLSGLVLVAVILGVTTVGGAYLFGRAARVPHGDWTRLPDPPESPVAFAGPTCYRMTTHDYGVVAVTAPQGGYFVYHHDTGPDGVWTTEPILPDSILQRAEGCQAIYRDNATPQVRGNVLARYRIDEDGTDCGARWHYLLMEDHSVWVWSTGGCAMLSFFGFLLYLAVLFGLGLAAGVGRLSTTVRSPWLSEADREAS